MSTAEAHIEGCRRKVTELEAAIETLGGRANGIRLSRWLANGIVRQVLDNVNEDTIELLRLANLPTTTDCNRRTIRGQVAFRRYYALKNKEGCMRAARRYARHANETLDILMFEEGHGIGSALHVDSRVASSPTMHIEGDSQIVRTTAATTTLNVAAHKFLLAATPPCYWKGEK